MRSTHGINVMVTVLVMIAALPLAAVGRNPKGVSPGELDRVSSTRDECPGFSWELALGAGFYELIVYQIAEDPEGDDTATFDLDRATEVLYTQVPGGATSWTPTLEQCLVAGGRYVWFVRAVFNSDTGEASEWSEPMLFSVVAAPSAAEVGRALDVLHDYIESGGDTAVLEQRTTQRSTGRRAAADRPRSGEPKLASRSVLTGTAAIRGEQPDATGETYGVVGASASPDGAGLGAANTAGGPDLVLDGTADGVADSELSQSGIDRPSPDPQTFAFANTGGGGMTIHVDGVEVVTTATDTDTLGGLSCTGNEIAKWTGASWVCAPDVDTDTDTLASLGPLCASGELARWSGGVWLCDEDNDTLASLSCAGDEVAKWDGSQWVCADVQGAGYFAGLGIVIDNGEIRLDPAAFSMQTTVLDSVGNVGWGSSLAIGADGLGLIAYEDDTNLDLKVAHCDDRLCTGATITAIDSAGGILPSVAIGTDGLGLIAYYNGNLVVAHCDDVLCTSATLSTLDSTADVGLFASLAIGADGLGMISYYDQTNGNLRLAHCDNVECTSATLRTRDFIDNVGWYTSLAIGADGLALVSYYDHTNDDLKVLHCYDVLCSTASSVTLDSHSIVGLETSLGIGADGLGLIVYRDMIAQELKVAHCENAQCSSATISTIGGGGDPSLVIGPDGLGLIALSSEGLGVAHCNNLACTSARFTALDGGAHLGADFISLAIGEDGLGLVSYYDEIETDDGNLNVAHLPVGL